MARSCIGAAFLLGVACPAFLSAQQLVKCDKPEGNQKIESFSVAFPTPIERTYNTTVQAFVNTGFVPNANTPLSNQVQWSSGEDENLIEGSIRVRFIRAVLFSTDSGSVVNLSAQETVKGNNDVRTTTDVLTNRNGGYGFKVWCAAWRISDTLKAMASRLAGTTQPASTASSPAAQPVASIPAATSTGALPPSGSYSVAFLELADGGSSQRVAASIVTAAFLPGTIQPSLGRVFQSSDFQASSPRGILLSDRLWRERYKAVPAVVGMTVQLNGQDAIVLGILAPDFDVPAGVELWVAKQQ